MIVHYRSSPYTHDDKNLDMDTAFTASFQIRTAAIRGSIATRQMARLSRAKVRTSQCEPRGAMALGPQTKPCDDEDEV